MRSRAVLAALALAGSVSEARADVLVFSNGRTMTVADYRVDGGLIRVTLPRGGHAIFEAAIVARIEDGPAPEPVEAPSLPVAVADMPAADAAAPERPFKELIDAVASAHGVDPSLVHAVVKAESNYHPRARSQAGARGLMQVMPGTAAEFGIRNLFDPRGNLEAGVQYLKSLLTQFSLSHAIAAYNAGPAAVRKYGGVPPFRETRDYVARVLDYVGRQ